MAIHHDSDGNSVSHSHGFPFPANLSEQLPLAEPDHNGLCLQPMLSSISRRFARLSLGSILCCPLVFGAWVGSPSPALAINPQYNDKFVVGGVSKPLKAWWHAYRKCQRDGEITKGEYETREEFEARRAKSAKNCDSMWPLENAVATKAARLSYDSDSETFSFTIDLGNTGWPRGVWDGPMPSYGERAKRYWRRVCDADVHCKHGEDYYWKIVCWVVDPRWLEDFRVFKSANEKFLDAEPRISVWQYQSKYSGSLEQAEITCNTNNDWKIQITARADIHKARRLKAMESSLRMKFVGNSIYHFKKSGPNHRSFFIYYISKISLIKREDGSEIFSLSRN